MNTKRLTGIFAAAAIIALNLVISTSYAGTIGMNFAVTRPTTISDLGISDGGVPFTGQVTLGIFSSATGVLEGTEVVFGPGLQGTRSGNAIFDAVTPFVLPSGEYSIVAIGDVGAVSGGATGLANVNSLQNLGGALNLPGGGRFDSGTLVDIAGYSDKASNPAYGTGTFIVKDPVSVVPVSVSDVGSTALLLGASMAGLIVFRRKVA
jgi:hypothetical protein